MHYFEAALYSLPPLYEWRLIPLGLVFLPLINAEVAFDQWFSSFRFLLKGSPVQTQSYEAPWNNKQIEAELTW